MIVKCQFFIWTIKLFEDRILSRIFSANDCMSTANDGEQFANDRKFSVKIVYVQPGSNTFSHDRILEQDRILYSL